jgi:hypothetical protein
MKAASASRLALLFVVVVGLFAALGFVALTLFGLGFYLSLGGL